MVLFLAESVMGDTIWGDLGPLVSPEIAVETSYTEKKIDSEMAGQQQQQQRVEVFYVPESDANDGFSQQSQLVRRQGWVDSPRSTIPASSPLPSPVPGRSPGNNNSLQQPPRGAQSSRPQRVAAQNDADGRARRGGGAGASQSYGTESTIFKVEEENLEYEPYLYFHLRGLRSRWNLFLCVLRILFLVAVVMFFSIVLFTETASRFSSDLDYVEDVVVIFAWIAIGLIAFDFVGVLGYLFRYNNYISYLTLSQVLTGSLSFVFYGFILAILAYVYKTQTFDGVGSDDTDALELVTFPGYEDDGEYVLFSQVEFYQRSVAVMTVFCALSFTATVMQLPTLVALVRPYSKVPHNGVIDLPRDREVLAKVQQWEAQLGHSPDPAKRNEWKNFQQKHILPLTDV